MTRKKGRKAIMDRRLILPVALVIVYAVLVGLIVCSDDIVAAQSEDHEKLLASGTFQPSLQVKYADRRFLVTSVGSDFLVRRLR